MTEMWNPQSLKGEKPFKSFDTWNDFIEHYAVPKNEIVRKGGPGDAVQEGEWYLTKAPTSWGLSFVMADSVDLLHNADLGGLIKYLHTGRVNSDEVGKDLFLGDNFNDIYTLKWRDGRKDAWGDIKYHYKVDIGNIFNFDFLNWINKNPFEIK